MDRLWADKHIWSANGRLMRELQAEHANGSPNVVHGDRKSASSVEDVDAKA